MSIGSTLGAYLAVRATSVAKSSHTANERSKNDVQARRDAAVRRRLLRLGFATHGPRNARGALQRREPPSLDGAAHFCREIASPHD